MCLLCVFANLAACFPVQESPGDDRQKLWSNPGPGTSFSREPIRTGFLRSKGDPSTALICPVNRMVRLWIVDCLPRLDND